MDEIITLSPQDVEAALEAYRGLSAQRRMLEKAEPILRVVQGAKNYIEAAQREAVKAHEDTESAKREAAETRARATAEAERIMGAATVEATRKRDEVTLLVGEEAQVTGRVNELRAEEKRLVDRIKRLGVKLGALEAIES